LIPKLALSLCGTMRLCLFGGFDVCVAEGVLLLILSAAADGMGPTSLLYLV
jgi:hypothetical protein